MVTNCFVDGPTFFKMSSFMSNFLLHVLADPKNESELVNKHNMATLND